MTPSILRSPPAGWKFTFAPAYRACRLLGLLLTLFTANVHAEDTTYRIGILTWQDVDTERGIVAGFREGIVLSGIAHEFELHTARGDAASARRTLQRWSEEGIDLIFSVGLDSTRIAQERGMDIPIVFAILADPVEAGLIEEWHRPGANITGVSHWVNPSQKMQFFCSALPTLNRFGAIYSADNINARAEVSAIEAAVEPISVSLHSTAIATGDDIESALQKLLQEGIEALWIPHDPQLASHLDTLRELVAHHRLPVVSSTLTGVEYSLRSPAFAVAGLSYDYHRLGRQAVRAAIKILAGGLHAGSIPVVNQDALIVANVNSAAAIDYKLPPLFLADSDRVISGFAGQKIVVAGTGDSQELLRSLARALEKKLNGGEIEIPESVGSSGGIKSLSAGRVDLARTARPLKPNEARLGLKSVLFARSPVVFVTHPSVTDVDNLDSREIVDIYAGQTIDWHEVGGPKHRIYAIMRESDDSSLSVINRFVAGFKDIEEYHAKTFYSTPATVKALVDHRYTLGYTSLSSVKNTPLSILRLDNIAPTAANVNNHSYPLVVPFSIVYLDTPSGLSGAFIDFLFSREGREIIRDFGAVPVER